MTAFPKGWLGSEEETMFIFVLRTSQALNEQLDNNWGSQDRDVLANEVYQTLLHGLGPPEDMSARYGLVHSIVDDAMEMAGLPPHVSLGITELLKK